MAQKVTQGPNRVEEVVIVNGPARGGLLLDALGDGRDVRFHTEKRFFVPFSWQEEFDARIKTIGRCDDVTSGPVSVAQEVAVTGEITNGEGHGVLCISFEGKYNFHTRRGKFTLTHWHGRF